MGHSVGFMSPNENAPANPSYREVCGGKTTHVEVVHIRFDNRIVSYEQLVKFLFTFHDPTTLDRQGNDKGDRYGSVIFYHSEAQKQTALKVCDLIQDLIIDKQITKY